MTDGDPVEVWVELEDGSALGTDQVDHWVEPREVEGSRIGEATFAVPADLPLGYHRLRARSGDTEASAHLIVTPAWLGLPEQADRRRQWGFATQLYSVRSGGSWGLGDLTDLTDLAVWSASELGADFVLVNPLHAAEPLAPIEPSPYLPSSRRFFNPIYLRVERIPEYAALPQPERDAVDQLVGQLPPWLTPQYPVDRDASWTAKRAALRIVHAAPRSAGGARLRGVPQARGRRAHRLRHLERARRGPRQRRPRVAGRAPPPRQPRRAGLRARPRGPGGLRVLAAVGARRAAPAGAGQGRGRRDEPRGHARPCRGGAPRRRRRMAAAGRLRAGRPGRRPAGRLQPGRPGLEPAAVAAGPARRARLPAVPRPHRRRAPARRWRPGRPRHRHVPAVVDPHRPPARGHLRPLRPRRADRCPRSRGASRGRRRRRRGPRRRRARGPRLPPRARGSSAPRSCGSSTTGADEPSAPRRALARVVPGLGHQRPRPSRPRPATSPARPRSSCSTSSGCWRATSTTSSPRRGAQVEAWLAEVRRRGVLDDV